IGCVDAITEIDERVEIAFARNGLNRDSRHAFPEALRKSGRSLLAFFTERAAARVAAGDPAGKLLHPRVGLRDFLVIAEIEHRRAALRAILLVVVGAEHPVPEVVGNPEVAVLVA